jgi:two-component system nitrate/nitrite response regulator NarL
MAYAKQSSGRYHARTGLSAVSLSPREHEVLALIADGRVTPESAILLYLSQSTVKTHLKNLYGKLGVSDRAAAVAEAMRRGIPALEGTVGSWECGM